MVAKTFKQLDLPEIIETVTSNKIETLKKSHTEYTSTDVFTSSQDESK